MIITVSIPVRRVPAGDHHRASGHRDPSVHVRRNPEGRPAVLRKRAVQQEEELRRRQGYRGYY